MTGLKCKFGLHKLCAGSWIAFDRYDQYALAGWRELCTCWCHRKKKS